MAIKPLDDLTFATASITDPATGQPNKIVPNVTYQTNGWVSFDTAPFSWFNYLFNGYYTWQQYFEATTDDILLNNLTIAGNKTFSGSTIFQANINVDINVFSVNTTSNLVGVKADLAVVSPGADGLIAEGIFPVTSRRDTSTVGFSVLQSFQMKNSSGDYTPYANFLSVIDDNTAGAECGSFHIRCVSAGNISTPQFIFNDTGNFTAITSITINDTFINASEIGINKLTTGNRTAKLDLYSDDTNPFGLEILRSSGVNGTTQLLHHGTGNLSFETLDTSAMNFSTGSTSRAVIEANGNFAYKTNLLFVDYVNSRIGIKKTPTVHNLEVLTSAAIGSTVVASSMIGINQLGTGDRGAYIDFVAEDTNPNSVRIIRNSGVNGSYSTTNQGDGQTVYENVGIGSHRFRNNGADSLYVTSANQIQAVANTNATSKDTGAFVVTLGGMGIEQDVWLGGSLNHASALLFKTGGNEGLRLSNSKLSTLGELTPDCSPGGLTLQQGPNDGYILTCKSTDVAHGMTTIAETDTYATFDKFQGGQGGLQIIGLNGGTGIRGISISSYAPTTDNTTSVAGTGQIELVSYLKTGTTGGSLASDANLLAMRNAGLTRHLFKGDGDIRTSTGVLSIYDNENDMLLVHAARNVLSGNTSPFKDNKEFKKYATRLNELGIIENGFVSHHKMMQLNLGAMGQVWNMIKGMAKEFNISEKKLLTFAKQY